MTWRVVTIADRAFLDFSMDYLVVRRGTTLKKIHIGEIQTLVVESLGTTLTSYLLSELLKHNVNVVFCDEKHLPVSQVLDLAGKFDASYMLQKQLSWTESTKALVWQECVRYKILNQAFVLQKHGYASESSALISYAQNVEEGDCTNREGYAAKVYFNALFGSKFSRKYDLVENSALNYGYAIILSAVARAVVSTGCINQLGIFHSSQQNSYNLACDFMELFRPIVDDFVVSASIEEFNSEIKFELRNLLNSQFVYNGKKSYLMYIIPQFVTNTINCMHECMLNNVRYFSMNEEK